MTLKRRLIVWFVLIAGSAAVYIALKAAIPYYSQPAPCDQPCQDLGDELLDPADSGEGMPDYRPKCNPLELTLELDKPEARVDQRYTLWYRVGIKNVCCQEVAAHMLFILGHGSTEPGLYLRVWGPDGKEVHWGDLVPGWDNVRAYRTDPHANPEVRERVDRFGYAKLSPGERVVTSPDVFAPYEDEGRGDSIEDWMKRTRDPKVLAGYREMIKEREARVRQVIAEMKPPMPPPGYRVLEGYVFKQPGDYRIQAVYDDNVSIEPRPTRGEVAPVLWRFVLGWGFVCTGWTPPHQALRRYRVHSESQIFTFKVAR